MKKIDFRNKNRYREVKLLNNDTAVFNMFSIIILSIGVTINSPSLIFLGGILLIIEAIITKQTYVLAVPTFILIFTLLAVHYFIKGIK